MSVCKLIDEALSRTNIQDTESISENNTEVQDQDTQAVMEAMALVAGAIGAGVAAKTFLNRK